MSNNELLAKIKAEIERQKEEAYNSILPDEPKYRTHYKVGKKELCEELLSFLSALESEKPVPNDLDFEQELYNHFGQIKDFTLGMRIAQYFYNLGRDSVPLPEDTVLFNKGVAEGRRLAEEEQADLFTIVALDAAQRAKEQMMKGAVKWLVDDDYHELSEKGRFILGSVGLGYNGYYIPYSDLLKLPKEDEK